MEKKQSDKPQGPSSNRSKKNASSKSALALVLSTTVLLLSLVALGIAGFSIYKNHALQKQIDGSLLSLSNKIQRTNQDISENETQFSKTLDASVKWQNKLDEKMARLGTVLNHAVKEQFYQDNDWMVLKARYYLQLAQINAHWGESLDATVTLLNNANILLSNLHQPQILSLRQAIASTISKIKAIPQADIAGVLSQLTAAQNAIPNLPLKQNMLIPSNEQDKRKKNQASSTWKAQWQKTRDLLKDVVIIRRHDKPIEPLLSEQEEMMLRTQLSMTLEKAQWAVMQKNEAIYQLALNQANEHIQKYFDVQTNSTQALLKTLNKLKPLPLTQQKPDLSPLLSLITDYINAQHAKRAMPAKQGENL